MNKKNKKIKLRITWHIIKTHLRKSSKKRKFFYGLCTVVIVLLFLMFVLGGIYQRQHSHDKVILGASFSIDAANDLGVDWRANYLALLNNLNIKNLRLMTYWDDYEPSPGVYNFSDLDWEMNQATAHNVKVVLSVGLRQPRWPECHQPAWADQLEQTNNKAWQDQLNTYITTVVNRYKNSPALDGWHLENEFFNRSFGACHDYNKNRLVGELDLIKRLDPQHPVD